MVIQHNIPALNAHRNMGINNSAISGNLEKLSSGYRINRAADDAAGLAISEKMRGQIRGLAMAEQNTSHGINLIQTAEGGLSETQDILQRMRELAVQASNGTYQDDDRAQLALEYNALKSEIDRIAESTHYNGIKLLNGNLNDDMYTQRVKDTDDILLNAAFGTSTKAGDEFLVSLASGAISEQQITESKEVANLPTSSQFGYDLEGLFSDDFYVAIMDSTKGGSVEFTFTYDDPANPATPFTTKVTLDRAAVTTYIANQKALVPPVIVDFPDDSAALKDVFAQIISNEINNDTNWQTSGGGQQITASFDGDKLIFTTDREGDNVRFDGLALTNIAQTSSGGGAVTAPLNAQWITDNTNTGAIVRGDLKADDLTVIGNTNFWSKATVDLDFTTGNFAYVSGTTKGAIQNGGANGKGDFLVFEMNGKEIKIELEAGALDGSNNAILPANKGPMNEQIARIIVAHFNTDEGKAQLAEMGLEVARSTATSLSLVASEYGEKLEFDPANFSFGNMRLIDVGTGTVVEGFTIGSTATAGGNGRTTTETVVVGKKLVLDDTAVSVNGDAIARADYNEKTNMIEIEDALGNIFTIDATRVLAPKTDEDGDPEDYEVTVRAAQGENLVFQIGANGGSDQRVYLAVDKMDSFNLGLYEGNLKSNGIAAMEDEVQMLSDSNITTVADANKAIDIITASTNQVSSQRAELGALQNRLESTLNSLGVSKENLTAAESTIRDVDMAAEMMEFTKNSILVQAAQAMLAQANQLPQGVLQLLR